jgi:DNA-binding transcriptional LysR family regulator
MRWLIPRLGRFHETHPQIEVVVHTVSTLQEDLRGGFDLAIRRGSPQGRPGRNIAPFRCLRMSIR